MSVRALSAPRPFTIGAIAVAAIAAIAIALRLYKLGSVPLWSDELFTAFYPKAGLGYLWTQGLRTEPTPPLYYSLILLIETIGGQAAWLLRVPSVFGSLLQIWLAARIARELSPRPATALIAALLLALTPTDIYFAQEARSYALQGAALALALLGFTHYLRDRRGLATYALGALLAIWLHPTSIVAVAAINAAALISVVGRNRLLDRPALLRWCAASAGVAVLCLPLLPVLLSPTSAAATNWVPPITRWSLQGVIGSTLAGAAFQAHDMQIGEIAPLLIVLAFLFPLWQPGRRAFTVLVLPLVIAFVLMVAISVGKSIMLTRTIAWMLIPLAIALADVLSRRPKMVAFAAITVVAATAVVNLARVDTLKENWRGFLAQLPGLAPPALIVLAPHTSPAALALYAPDAGQPVRIDEGPPVPETTVIPRVLGTPTITRADLVAAIASGRPVWLIYRRPEYGWMQQVTAGLPPPKRAVQDIKGSNPGIRALFW